MNSPGFNKKRESRVSLVDILTYFNVILTHLLLCLFLFFSLRHLQPPLDLVRSVCLQASRNGSNPLYSFQTPLVDGCHGGH